jgi:hypothetical protein
MAVMAKWRKLAIERRNINVSGVIITIISVAIIHLNDVWRNPMAQPNLCNGANAIRNGVAANRAIIRRRGAAGVMDVKIVIHDAGISGGSAESYSVTY